jgi:hypothetical protein
MNDDRKRDVENFLRKLKHKDSDLTGGFIPGEYSLGKQAIEARDLAEDALANQVLKNTGIPIPHKNASHSKVEDFFNRLVEERYPEINPNVQFSDKLVEAHGIYNPHSGNIKINPNSKKDINSRVATVLHEAGHQYDDQVLGYKLPEELRNAHKTQLDIPGMYDAAKKTADELDPTNLYEIAAKGHHANIPNLREGSFGLGRSQIVFKEWNLQSHSNCRSCCYSRCRTFCP